MTSLPNLCVLGITYASSSSLFWRKHNIPSHCLVGGQCRYSDWSSLYTVYIVLFNEKHFSRDAFFFISHQFKDWYYVLPYAKVVLCLGFGAVTCVQFAN